MSNFNRIASSYDFLARLVFGKNMVDVQEYSLKEIKDGDRILILGGGTGWILNSINENCPPGEIWYVDISDKMIKYAKSKVVDKINIHFIHGTIEDIAEVEKFDVVITNFFLDVFSEKQLESLIPKTMERIKPDGLWLCSDFIATGKFGHQLMLSLMYLFFKLTVNLRNKKLPNWEAQLCKSGLVLLKEKEFLKGFMKATVFRKHLVG